MTIKLAFTGTGYISRVHAQAAQQLSQVELTAVVNHRTESMSNFAGEFAISRTYMHVEDLLRDGGVDALVVSTPNVLHAPQSIAALQAGVHVLVEKPMAMNAAEAKAMFTASQESGALLMVAHNLRFHEEIQWLKGQVQAGKIGEVVRTKGYGVHVNWGPSGWFTQKALAGGGALADMGIHAIDTTRYLLGDPLPQQVYATVDTHYMDGDVDDTGMMIVTWENGIVSYIEGGWWQPHSEAAAQVYGTRGYASAFPALLKVYNPEGGDEQVIDPGFVSPRQPESAEAMYTRQMASFVDCIEKGTPPSPGGMEGWVNMRVLDAAYQSAQSRQAVST